MLCVCRGRVRLQSKQIYEGIDPASYISVDLLVYQRNYSKQMNLFIDAVGVCDGWIGPNYFRFWIWTLSVHLLSLYLFVSPSSFESSLGTREPHKYCICVCLYQNATKQHTWWIKCTSICTSEMWITLFVIVWTTIHNVYAVRCTRRRNCAMYRYFNPHKGGYFNLFSN